MIEDEPAVRQIVSANLIKLMQAHAELRTLAALHGRSGVSMSTISHLIHRTTGPSIDVLDALARAFSLEAWQLLVRGLDPSKPLAVPDLSGRDEPITDYDLLEQPEFKQWIDKKPNKA